MSFVEFLDLAASVAFSSLSHVLGVVQELFKSIFLKGWEGFYYFSASLASLAVIYGLASWRRQARQKIDLDFCTSCLSIWLRLLEGKQEMVGNKIYQLLAVQEAKKGAEERGEVFDVEDLVRISEIKTRAYKLQKILDEDYSVISKNIGAVKQPLWHLYEAMGNYCQIMIAASENLYTYYFEKKYIGEPRLSPKHREALIASLSILGESQEKDVYYKGIEDFETLLREFMVAEKSLALSVGLKWLCSWIKARKVYKKMLNFKIVGDEGVEIKFMGRSGLNNFYVMKIREFSREEKSLKID